jgi:hypothetical protein
VDCRICNSLGSHIRTVALTKVVLVIRGKFAAVADVQVTGHKMVRSALCFALISGSIIGAALCLGANDAPAAGDCITESNLVPPKGSRWGYDIDRATNRKCWYIVPLSTASAAPRTQRTSARSGSGQTRRSKHQVRESEPVAATQHETIRSASGQTALRGSPPLSESYQAALFQEFLRWKEQQGAVEPPRQTIPLRVKV